MTIAVIHGPNLRQLGRREPEVYGTTTLAEIDADISALAVKLGVEVEFFQSNVEGEILDFVHKVSERVDGFLINPAALTHTSVALRDAMLAVDRPFVEVHLSNTAAREAFRSISFLADIAAGVVQGFGSESYLLGLRGLVGCIAGSSGTV